MPSNLAPGSFPIFRLRARAVKDTRPTELPGRTEASSRVTAWQVQVSR
jgi:hypothetical protein